MRSIPQKRILAPVPDTRALLYRRLRQAALVLGTGGLLTWMMFGSGDLPTHNLPRGEKAQPPAPPEKKDARAAFGGGEPPRPVVIAIIDTGIDQKAFRDLLWTNPFETADGIDNDGNGLIDDVHGYNFIGDNHRIDDRHGHGTHVAGIVRRELRLREALGIEGRPIRLMILKYFDPGVPAGRTMRASLEAFRYAIDRGADIINYSGGGAVPSAEEEALLVEAARRNILLVAAAGNEGLDSDDAPFYPASYGTPNILSVGATDDRLGAVPSSNFGRHSVDVTAPGAQVLSDLPEGRTGRMTGTSQATAFVTAAAALIMSEHRSPPPVERVIDRVLGTGRIFAHLEGRTRSGAHLDALRAATQRDSQTTLTGESSRSSARIPAKYFSHHPDESLQALDERNRPN